MKLSTILGKGNSVKIIPHPGKPHVMAIRIEEEDNITPEQLIAYALARGAVDGPPGPYQLIWVQYEDCDPTSYYVAYLRRCNAHGAKVNKEQWVHTPKGEEVL